MLIKYFQELDIERLSNELIENLDYITDEEIAQLQNKAQQIKGICKAAIGYRRKSQEDDVKRQRKQIKQIKITKAAAIATTYKQRMKEQHYRDPTSE
ncbi:hypothetical protein BH18THE2_BH18THE2_39340 [soil metagenome]